MKSLFNLQKSGTKDKTGAKIRVAMESDYPEVMVAFAEALAEFNHNTKKGKK